METHKIISVKIVKGNTLNPRWSNNMQVVETDKGTYIDNIEDAQFGFHDEAKPGFDWGAYAGKSVSNIRIFNSCGYK